MNKIARRIIPSRLANMYEEDFFESISYFPQETKIEFIDYLLEGFDIIETYLLSPTKENEKIYFLKRDAFLIKHGERLKGYSQTKMSFYYGDETVLLAKRIYTSEEWNSLNREEQIFSPEEFKTLFWFLRNFLRGERNSLLLERRPAGKLSELEEKEIERCFNSYYKLFGFGNLPETNEPWKKLKERGNYVPIIMQFEDAEVAALSIVKAAISDSVSKDEGIKTFTELIIAYDKTLGEMKMEILLPGKKKEIVNLLKFKIQGVENLKSSLLEKINLLKTIDNEDKESNTITGVKDFEKEIWFKVGLKFADGTLFNHCENMNQTKKSWVTISKEVFQKDYHAFISFSYNHKNTNLNNANANKNIFLYPIKLKQIKAYCDDNQITIDQRFSDRIKAI